MVEYVKREYKNIIVFVALSILFISFFSKASPFYAICDLTDANAWIIQVKQMLNGGVLYRDIYEHKGPWQLFIFLFTAIPLWDAVTGVYIMEIFLLICSMIGIYETLKAIGSSRPALITSLGTLFITASNAFTQCGTSEELLLPTIIWSIYFFVKRAKEDRRFTPAECVIIGIFGSLHFWTKYSICAFDLFLMLTVCYLGFKGKYSILKEIGFYLLGFLIPTIPVVLYFGLNRAFGDLWNVYFYTVLFKYEKVQAYWVFYLMKTEVLLPLILMALASLGSGDNAKKFIILSFVYNAVILFFMGQWWAYYFLYLFAYVPLFMAYATEGRRRPRKIIFWAICGVFLFLYLQSNNLLFIGKTKDDYKQFEMIDVINSEEGSKFLLYEPGSENKGFFLYSGKVPEQKYFANYNITSQEALDEQSRLLQSGEYEFVISGKRRNISGYELIGQYRILYHNSFSYLLFKEREYDTYYLYQTSE